MMPAAANIFSSGAFYSLRDSTNSTQSVEAALQPEAEARSTPADDLLIIAAVKAGEFARFEELIAKYQPRVFATARRYARREIEVEDIVQEVFIKAYQRLDSFRGEAPFEHWLMRLAVRTCYDFLRKHQRNREDHFSEITSEEFDLLERFQVEPGAASSDAANAAREIVNKVLQQLSPPARLILTLLEIEDRSIKEIAEITGWSQPLVKVRAFRARGEMRKCLERMGVKKWL
ncbi:MAG: sigma-70 family RNA polymerase sigma factor [Verrucomicrobiota bacterium]|nr:sigma-70 family RNA polymerase sigma factor [Verrucomicrobiota bacterium]